MSIIEKPTVESDPRGWTRSDGPGTILEVGQPTGGSPPIYVVYSVGEHTRREAGFATLETVGKAVGEGRGKVAWKVM